MNGEHIYTVEDLFNAILYNKILYITQNVSHVNNELRRQEPAAFRIVEILLFSRTDPEHIISELY